MGEYEELDRDLVRASSVRGEVAAPAGSYESMQVLALSARALQRFHDGALFELEPGAFRAVAP